MSFPFMLLQLVAAATLLIWAVRMVRTGVERAYGPELRQSIRKARSGNIIAAGIGAVLAIVLQSSTAVAMLAAGFASVGLLTIATGLALLLGADLGTAIVVQILSNDLDWLIPVLITVGGWMFLKSGSRTVRQIGRILMGIALILVSLEMIGVATAPIREGGLLTEINTFLQSDYLTAFIVGAIFTWFIHSSVAAILLVVSLLAQSVLTADVAASLVLGANVGSGLIALGLSRGMDAKARRVPIGNLAYRGAGAIVALLALQLWPQFLGYLGSTPEGRIVNFHLAFNAVLLVICLPSVAMAARLLEQLFPEDADGDKVVRQPTTVLDPTAIERPRLALMSATRELLQIGALVEQMLRDSMDALTSGNREIIETTRDTEQEVRRRNGEVKLYLAELNRTKLSSRESSRSMQLSDFGVSLENMASVISNSLLRLAEEKRDRGQNFSEAGLRDIGKMHDRVLANFQLSLNVLISGDHETARQLVEEKDKVRAAERKSVAAHMKRLRENVSESVDTSDIHLETLRDLKHINSLFTTVAVPVLTERGDLLESRLSGISA